MLPRPEYYTVDELVQLSIVIPRAVQLAVASYWIVFGMFLVPYVALLWYERKRRLGADELALEDARESVLMPFHKPLILFILVVSFVFGLGTALLPLPTTLTEGEVLFCMRNFNVNLVVWAMHYPTVSTASTCKAMAWTALLSLAPLPIVYAVEQTRSLHDVYDAILALRAITCAHYLHNVVRPPTSRGAASSIRQYAALGVVYTLLTMAYHVLFKYHYFVAGLNCVYAASGFLLFVPCCLYKILRDDTRFWRGLATAFPPLRVFRELTGRFKLLTADEVAAYDEAVRQTVVALGDAVLNFTDVDFDEPHSPQGVGRTATVASGCLQSTHGMLPQRVAIKVFNPELFLADQVHQIATEARLHAWPAMRFKYIVHGFGLTVRPPALCLVTDLCETTLLTHLQERRESLSLRLCLTYMLHCAKALAWVHMNNVLHRDVRPANFFVQTLFETPDLQKIIKLGDFGDAVGPVDDMVAKVARPVVGVVGYMAPEVMRGASALFPHRPNVAYYSASADVFGLTMTFWDILHPGSDEATKFDEIEATPRCVADKLLQGFRPALAPDVAALPGIARLLHEGWSDNPKIARPTALDIVTRLKGMLESLKHGAVTIDIDDASPTMALPVYDEYYDV
ncbi:protein kinase [Achlya hypogyna]|uniref:Protein kinase n=1 Tax=Achlya hypogyna TaxID=1202772 RepID=A0A1V9YU51_ACHHY|nr:protein kinase [Achlya hypogyna]